MKTRLALVLAFSAAVLAACGAAWAQEAAPVAAGLGELGTGASGGLGGGLLVVAVREGLDYLRRSRAEDKAETARDRAGADAQALRDRLSRLEGEHAAMRRDLDALGRSLSDHRAHVDERLDTIAERVGEAGRQIATALGRLEAHRASQP